LPLEGRRRRVSCTLTAAMMENENEREGMRREEGGERGEGKEEREKRCSWVKRAKGEKSRVHDEGNGRSSQQK